MSAFNEYGDCTNPIYKELRTIYCCTGAEFCRPTLEHAWEEIDRLERLLKKSKELLVALKDDQEERNK